MDKKSVGAELDLELAFSFLSSTMPAAAIWRAAVVCASLVTLACVLAVFEPGSIGICFRLRLDSSISYETVVLLIVLCNVAVELERLE